ncbi:MAG TPA: OmpW family outer membrane protein [Porticoccaceae bacterium]|nr:OmpW family outer membrane protein [Porticoccaceae bacterium]
MKQHSALVLATLGMLAGSSALAYQPGDFIMRAGVASVQPNEDSGELKLNGTPLAGTEAGVDNNEQLGLTFTYMLTSNWGLGLLAATPFEHDIRAKGVGVDAGSIKHLPPTLTVQYFPLDASSSWQPYVGLGVNYTLFFDEDVDSELEGLFGPGDLELDDSLGWAGQLGVDYLLDEHWLLNASVWYLDIDTDATFKFAANRVTANVDVDPWVYMLGVGYRF